MALIDFKALQLANEQRNAYGLRYNDYQRYRKHCANRTHRLRSTIKITHGKGREFKKLPVFNTGNLTAGHLQLLLMEAERAWAYSQELTALSLLPANEDKARTLRHSATGRFRRSVHHCTQLLSHCQSLFAASLLSAESLLQITIYTLILNGRFLRYRDEFDDALVQLSVARGLLDDFCKTAATSRDQALGTLFSDSINPEIRYCAHELGRAKAYDVDGIVAEYYAKERNGVVEGCDSLIQKLKGEVAASTGRTLQPLIWEGEPVPIRHPEIVDVLLKVQDAEARLDMSKMGKKGVKAYDAILLALSDAEQVSRKLSETQKLNGASGSSAPGTTRDIHFVNAYIVYQLLSRRIQRDLLLVSALLTSQESSNKVAKTTTTTEQVDTRLFPALVKLLDTVLQSLNQMRVLSIVDDSPDLTSAVEARIAFISAQRYIYLARSYASAPLLQYAEALVLLQHAALHLREARSTLTSLSSASEDLATPSPLTLSDIDTWDSEHASRALEFKKTWFAFNGGVLSADAKQKYKKPIFFDIAMNYVKLDMDSLQARAGLSAPAPVQKQQKAAVVERKEKVNAPRPAKADGEIEVKPAAPAVQQKSGLGSLLGGWWGK